MVDVVPVRVVQSRCRFTRVVVILAVGETLFLVSDRSDEIESSSHKTCPKDEAYTRTYFVVDGWVVHNYKVQGVRRNVNMTFVTRKKRERE